MATVKILNQAFLNIISNHPNPYMLIGMVPDENKFVILFRGFRGAELSGPNDCEFDGGEYLCVLNFKDINAPPTFEFLTPNGVYQPGKKPCISIGHYHSDQYSPVEGPGGFIMSLIFTFLNYKELVSGIAVNFNSYSKKDRRKFAKQSVNYNWSNHREYMNVAIEGFRNVVHSRCMSTDAKERKRVAGWISYITAGYSADATEEEAAAYRKGVAAKIKEMNYKPLHGDVIDFTGIISDAELEVQNMIECIDDLDLSDIE